MPSMFGDNIKMSIFGQSHSEGIGVVIDGLPAGIDIDMDKLQAFLSRRAPGQGKFTTARKEADLPEFISGLVGNTTCGAPLCALIRNTDVRSGDYEQIRDLPRPSHADYPAFIKFGKAHDIRGGGHFSARLTAPICIAGGIALQILEANGIYCGAHIANIGNISDKPFDPVNVSIDDFKQARSNTPAVLDESAGTAMLDAIESAREDADSIGGSVECAVIGLPAGVGDALFGGIDGKIAAALFGIPAVKGVEFGAGFAASELRGSQNNDPYCIKDGQIVTSTNNAGGVLGGITTGMPLIVRVGLKPTPSIGKEQRTVRLSTNAEDVLTIKGRHDPCIVPRAVPVVEAVVAFALLDAMSGLLTIKEER